MTWNKKDVDDSAKDIKPGKDDFLWTDATLCHRTRRKQIIERYPEVEDLGGWDARGGLLTTVTVILQLFVARWLGLNDFSWYIVVLLTYCLSATCQHSLFFATHEASHFTLWPTSFLNKVQGVFMNVAMGIPVTSSFFHYHRYHHVFQGVDDRDPDLPTLMEAKIWQGKLGKLMYLLGSPLSYTLRPLFVRPKPIAFFDVVNFSLIATTNALICYHWGPKALFYLVAGSIFGFSIHPLAAHLIAEHFQFPWGHPYQETFSYYGPLNLLTYNVGYHVEHHDFPTIPGFRLPLLRKIAPEFYDTLPHHSSWLAAAYEFITNDEITIFSRVRRRQLEQPAANKLIDTYRSEYPTEDVAKDDEIGGLHTLMGKKAKAA